MYKQYYMQPNIDFDNPNAGKVGLFFTSPSSLALMLGLTPEKFQDKLKKFQTKGGNGAGKFKNKVEIKLDRKKTPITTENVLGFLEGTDLKDEVLVVTSHYDHIGIGTDGKINNGADDDGSGTVGLLEIAEAFSKAASEGKRPRRSILFMTVTGEEKGLLGSEYYSNNPIFPIEKTVTNLNIDMIGRSDERHADNKPYVYIIGSDMLSSELHQLHEETAKEFAPQMQMDYLYNTKDSPERFYYRSDHYNFAKHGIPIIFYFNGVHTDYHRPTDDVDKINFDLLAQRAQLVFATAWQIANRDARPKVDKPISKDE
jgi:Zn-dependent M28 family amino/carboxypeptidase